MNKQQQMESVFDALVDLVLKMLDKKNAEYNPSDVPALVEQLLILFSNVR